MRPFQMISAVVLAALVTVLSGQARAQQTSNAPQPPAIDQRAADILKVACATPANAKAMSFDALNTYQRAARNGQPPFYTTLNHVTMQRPDKLRVITPGDGIAGEFYYDGKAITAYVPSGDLVAIADAPPTIDKMIDTAWEKAADEYSNWRLMDSADPGSFSSDKAAHGKPMPFALPGTHSTA